MPIPLLISDLNATAALNSPQGTESAKGTIDDYFRAHAAFIRQVSDIAAGPTVTLASAATVAIGFAASNNIAITGTTTITAFDIAAEGALRNVQFSGILTLTHNAVSMILPGAANIVTAAGDAAVFKSLGGGNWKCIAFQRASGSAIKSEFAAGTRMPFAQAAAPTGWTQDVSDNANNRMLRVVNTAGGGVAGTHSPILNSVVPSHTHAMTTGTESATHTHAVSDPGHGHQYSQPVGGTGGAYISASAAAYSSGNNATTVFSLTGITLGTQSANHTHSGTTDGGSSATNWAPRYIDMIICVKA